MALVACPACAREVSDAAVACPHCGHPFRAPRKTEGAFMQVMNIGCMTILVVLAAIFGVLLIVMLAAGLNN